MRNQLFNSIKVFKPKTNLFDLSHEKKLSFNMGELIPILLQEVVPGDKFKGNSEIFLRFAPMVAPIMHRINVYTHFFFVPNRLVWNNWEKFITGDVTGLDASSHPFLRISNTYKAYFGKGSLSDYLGIPDVSGLTVNNAIFINSLPFRAYQLIYNTYYRDQTLQTEVAFQKTDGEDTNPDVVTLLRNRCWEKDYFTSGLNDTQRGGDVLLPGTPDYSASSHIYQEDNDPATSGAVTVDGDSPPHLHDAGGADLRVENLDGYDISVNDLRTSVALQQFLEKQMRGGSRYIETILNHFGLYGDDARLQRPEYLGGGKSPVVISEVLNTSDTASAPQGNMAGHGVSVGKTNSFSKYFKEHGWILGIMSVLPRTCYMQGISREFFKTDKYSYYWPSFANLGEQPIYYKEIYPEWTGTDNNDSTFAYQSRYAEYKHKASTVHGDFRDNLDEWHMARKFTGQPTLNSSFVQSDPTHRVFAVTDSQYDKMYCQVYNNLQGIRPMPKFGIPKL